MKAFVAYFFQANFFGTSYKLYVQSQHLPSRLRNTSKALLSSSSNADGMMLSERCTVCKPFYTYMCRNIEASHSRNIPKVKANATALPCSKRMFEGPDDDFAVDEAEAEANDVVEVEEVLVVVDT